MPQMTVQQFNIKTDEQGNPKKDNYGNTQLMIKFDESPETVYKAVKDPDSVTKGKIMYGSVVEGQYGFKFQADPYNQPGSAPSQPFSSQTAPQPPQATVASDELLTLAKDNNRMLKALVGETESTNETDTPPVEAYDEPDFGG